MSHEWKEEEEGVVEEEQKVAEEEQELEEEEVEQEVEREVVGREVVQAKVV